MILSRSGKRLSHPLDLQFCSGDYVAIAGNNGSGKTSLLRLIAGLAQPKLGRIEIAQEGVGSNYDATSRQQYCAYLGHESGLDPALTLREHFDLFQVMNGETLDKGNGNNLTFSPENLENSYFDQRVVQISAGQRRKLALAAVATSERPIWCLDEPGAALDEDGKTKLAVMIADHRRAGGIVFASFHGERIGAPSHRLNFFRTVSK